MSILNGPARSMSLAPADLAKEGAHFDLPIAVGLMAVSRQAEAGDLDQCEFLGELSLTGRLRSIKGALPPSFGGVMLADD